MKYINSFLFTLLAFISFSNAQSTYKYSSSKAPWPEKFGNHRAVLSIDKPADAVSLSFEWRRPDAHVVERMLLIVNAATGDTVRNIHRLQVDNDVCKLQFGPVKERGTYYFYYLPYQVQPGHGFYGRGYYPKEEAPDADWLKSISKKTPTAKIIEVQSRTAFDSFFPMEIAATQAETATYAAKHPAAMLLFPEGRENPIRMRQKLPSKWLAAKQGESFAGVAQPNEYYAFQVGVWAPKGMLTELKYAFTDLKSGSHSIPKERITCFNTEGIDPYGKPFTKQVNVEKGNVQPLWFGIDIAENQPAGEYTGSVEISDQSGNRKTVPVKITVSGAPLADRGDNEPWRHSRLRWLNSTLGIADTPIKPFGAMSLKENTVSMSGKTIVVDNNTGLPRQISAMGKTVLSEPMKFVIETAQGIKQIPLQATQTHATDGSVSFTLKGEDNELSIELKTTSEFDGWSNYTYSILPKKDINVKDIRLEIAMAKATAPYFMGAGLPGQDMPESFDGKWDTPEKKPNELFVSIPTNEKNSWLWPFDSFWMGGAHAGLHCELRGTSYSGPLLNLYRPAYPAAWHNEGKGGFSLRTDKDVSRMTVYSGERTLKIGETVTFEFATLITPVKSVNYTTQFKDRYFHNPRPTDDDLKSGIKIINVHHGNRYNPVINYPFIAVDTMKQFVDTWHEKGCKVKIYYTIRELTNAVTEIWALRSLGDEVLRGGASGEFKTLGGFPWLREHFVTDYTPQWYHHFADITESNGIQADAALLTAVGDSRWYNYYIEGLAWLTKNVDIDGLYLDDVAYDRRMLKRMRRAMGDVKEGCVIDLHSNTGFSRGPAMQYAEYLPYVDKLWLGESFIYDEMSPANWLVEVSGIPFGLMGDMLHAGGNKWLGMQYGMTVRYPWFTEGVFVDPRPVWKIWDEFDIASSNMIGFWEENPPITSDNPAVKVTSYVKNDSVLVSIGNYSDEVQEAQLIIDWDKLKISAKNAKLVMPEIEDFQPARQMQPSDKIAVEPRKGWLGYLSSERD